MNILPFGDRALLVNFEQKIDPAINARIVDLAQKVERIAKKGVLFTTPSYCSLVVGFNPEMTTFTEMEKMILVHNVW